MIDKHSSPFRSYRSRAHADLQAFQIVIEETDLWIAAQQDLSTPIAAYVRQLRGQIQAQGAIFPDFLTTLVPWETTAHAPAIIQRMTAAAKLVHVGPMAAVAGVIAQMVVEKFSCQSPNLLVENGGDIYISSTSHRYIGILNIPDQKLKLAVPVQAHEFPCAFCASSAKIGQALSFGNADLVVVRSKDGALADAAATALANMLHKAQDMDLVLAQGKKWQTLGIDGLFAQCQGKIGLWGQMELATI